jgi:hypothetical protein
MEAGLENLEEEQDSDSLELSGLTVYTELRFGNLRDPQYSFITTGDATNHKTGQAKWIIPGLAFQRISDRYKLNLRFSMVVADNGNADAGYFLASYIPYDYGIRYTYFITPGVHVFGYFGGAYGRNQFTDRYGWDEPCFEPGVVFDGGMLAFELGFPFINTHQPGLDPRLELWVNPTVSARGNRWTAMLQLKAMVLNGAPNNTTGKWRKLGNKLKEAGGPLQNMDFTFEYDWGRFLAGTVFSFPLQTNALGSDVNQKVYGDFFGIFINPYFQATVWRGLKVGVGAYIHNIGNNSAYWTEAHGYEKRIVETRTKVAFRPWIRIGYSF